MSCLTKGHNDVKYDDFTFRPSNDLLTNLFNYLHKVISLIVCEIILLLIDSKITFRFSTIIYSFAVYGNVRNTSAVVFSQLFDFIVGCFTLICKHQLLYTTQIV